MDHKRYVNELVEEGVTLIPEAYTPKQCKDYIEIFEGLVRKFTEEKRPLDKECQIIENPFRHDARLAELIYHPVLEKVLGELLDPDYVLINSNIINRRRRNDIYPGGITIGMDWHTDSRYLNGKRMEPGFGYIVFTMFNEFTPDNAGTMYVPRSHLRRDRPEREGKYEYKQLCGSPGTIGIIDSGTWHRGGTAGDKDRWSMASYYGPWFVKPYFMFPQMLGKEFGDKLSKPLKRLFHYNSIPPVNEDERRNIVEKL